MKSGLYGRLSDIVLTLLLNSLTLTVVKLSNRLIIKMNTNDIEVDMTSTTTKPFLGIIKW